MHTYTLTYSYALARKNMPRPYTLVLKYTFIFFLLLLSLQVNSGWCSSIFIPKHFAADRTVFGFVYVYKAKIKKYKILYMHIFLNVGGNLHGQVDIMWNFTENHELRTEPVTFGSSAALFCHRGTVKVLFSQEV